MAQLVKHLTNDNLMVCDFEPCFGLCADSAEPAWDSLSLFASPLLARSLYLKNKH